MGIYEFKESFKNLNELYNCKGMFWQYGTYQSQLKLIKSNKKPFLKNIFTNEEIKGLKNINTYLKIHNYKIEI